MELTGIMLFVKDMKTIIAFYRDVIGLVPDEDQPFQKTGFSVFMQELAPCVSIVPANLTKGDKN